MNSSINKTKTLSDTRQKLKV